MASWSRGLFVSKVVLDHINCLGSGGEVKIVMLGFFSLVLYNTKYTCPGPGILWS